MWISYIAEGIPGVGSLVHQLLSIVREHADFGTTTANKSLKYLAHNYYILNMIAYHYPISWYIRSFVQRLIHGYRSP